MQIFSRIFKNPVSKRRDPNQKTDTDYHKNYYPTLNLLTQLLIPPQLTLYT